MAILAKRNQIFMYSIGIISLTRIFNNFFIYFRFNEYFDLLFKKTINYKYICLIGILIIISLADNIIINFKIDYISPKKYPVKATEFIKQNLDYKNLRIYNSFNYGSYLEFNNILAFIDSRSEIYCKEFNDTTILEDWLSVNNNIKHYSEIFTKYGIDYILINKKESIFIYIDKDENFEKIYNDEFFYIYKCKDKTI